MELKLTWSVRKFDELTNEELYQMLRLRSEVFIVEQHCIFMDMDNKDQKCTHLLGWKDGDLLAHSRIVPPGLSYEYPSIGRIVVSGKGRGLGLGVELLNVSIAQVEMLFGKSVIRIGAQQYLKRFYESFGFQQSSDIYLEDEIEHIEMTRQINSGDHEKGM
jgi:ElaA protein